MPDYVLPLIGDRNPDSPWRAGAPHRCRAAWLKRRASSAPFRRLHHRRCRAMTTNDQPVLPAWPFCFDLRPIGAADHDRAEDRGPLIGRAAAMSPDLHGVVAPALRAAASRAADCARAAHVVGVEIEGRPAGFTGNELVLLPAPRRC